MSYQMAEVESARRDTPSGQPALESQSRRQNATHRLAHLVARKLYLTFLGTLYRPLNRFMHRFNLHYMPERGPCQPDDGKRHFYCSWCGANHVMYRTNTAQGLYKRGLGQG